MKRLGCGGKDLEQNILEFRGDRLSCPAKILWRRGVYFVRAQHLLEDLRVAQAELASTDGYASTSLPRCRSSTRSVSGPMTGWRPRLCSAWSLPAASAAALSLA